MSSTEGRAEASMDGIGASKLCADALVPDELKEAFMVMLEDSQIQQKIVALLRHQLRLNPLLLR
jgi:hypothetical protein